jgi:thioredoxin-dependent peroxiredoxin
MAQLTEGMKAPYFEGIDQNGKVVKLSDFEGRFIILYFYPKDDTPGCATEACNLRDHYDELRMEGFVVVGVSMDTENSHKNFALKYSLPFPILADTTKKIVTDYGVLKEKNLYGKSHMGIARTTFLINEEGIIEIIINKVETKSHASQIFELYSN